MTYLFENTADNTFWNTEDNEWYGERGIRPVRLRKIRKPTVPLAAPTAPYPGVRPYMYESYFDMITKPSHKAIFDAYKLAGVPITKAAFETPYLSVDYSDMKYQPPAMRGWAPRVFPAKVIERVWMSRLDNSYWRGGANVHWGEEGIEATGSWTQHLDDSDWERTVPGVDDWGLWDEANQQWTARITIETTFAIEPIGTWATNYRPALIRVTYTIDTGVPNLVLNSTTDDANALLYHDDYVSAEELTFSWGEDDINHLRFELENINADIIITNIEFDSGKYRPRGWYFPTNTGLLSVKLFWTDDYRPGSVRITWKGNATYVQATLTDVPGTDFDTWTATANRQIHKIQWGHHDLQSITFTGDDTFYLTDLEFLEDVIPEPD